jgi:hypothetical protein
LFFAGCKKTADATKEILPEDISRQELILWINNYQKLMPNGPKPILEQTLKTYYKGQMILKMPLSSGGGHFYFAKTNKLQVQFFRIVSSEDKINNPFNGYYEFIDMTTYKYNKIRFKQGIRQAETKTTILNSDVIQNTSTIKSTQTWLGALFECISTYIFAIPKRDSNGEWQCYGLGGGSPDPAEVDAPDSDLEGGSGGVDFASWLLLFNNPNYYTPTPIPDPSLNWNLYLGGIGGSNPSNPPVEIIPDSNEIGDFIDDPNIYEDDPMQITFNYDQDPWPTISNILSPSLFVIYDNRNCLDLVRAQIAKVGLRDLGYGSAFKVYDKNGGPYPINAKSGINYIISKLQIGKPVIVGIDNRPGTLSTLNSDGKTDHFVTIVGTGQDSQGVYLMFFDNGTNIVSKGTNLLNKLYFDSLTGRISGRSTVPYANAFGDYIVTQIRKNQ